MMFIVSLWFDPLFNKTTYKYSNKKQVFWKIFLNKIYSG